MSQASSDGRELEFLDRADGFLTLLHYSSLLKFKFDGRLLVDGGSSN